MSAASIGNAGSPGVSGGRGPKIRKLAFWTIGRKIALIVATMVIVGIGVMTVGMMSRVSLGHTGRNVFEPPRILGVMFLFLVAALLSRVIMPLFDLAHYALWVEVSQILWVIAFGLFLFVYTPILIKPRIDGQYG